MNGWSKPGPSPPLDLWHPLRVEERTPTRAWPEIAAQAGLLAAVAVFLWDAWPIQPHVDDAYISYRYARNLVEGAGLVFNPGEYVEGFTNPLWTLLVAAGLAAGFGAKQTAHTLGVASGVATLIAMFAYARALLPRSRSWLAALPPFVLVGSVSLPRWSTSGLETVLFTAWVTAALAFRASDRRGWLTASAILATATRPEGALLAALLLGLPLLQSPRDPRQWRPVLVYAAAVVAMTLARLFYYGSPLPNTFFAKVGGSDPAFGVQNLQIFLAQGAGVLLPAVLAACWLERRARLGGLVCLAWLGYVVAVGGDYFATRFLLPIHPPLAALAACGASAAWDARRVVGVAIGLCLPAALAIEFSGVGLPEGAGHAPSQDRSRWARLSAIRHIDRSLERMGQRQVRQLRERIEPTSVVATTGIGVIGYETRLTILDLLGLVDATIARSGAAPGRTGPPGHQRSNADYVLGRRPDYILIPRRPDDPGRAPVVHAIRDLWEHPDFDRLYRWDPGLPGYRRRAEDARPGSASGLDFADCILASANVSDRRILSYRFGR